MLTLDAVVEALRKEVQVRGYFPLEGAFTNFSEVFRESSLAPRVEAHISISQKTRASSSIPLITSGSGASFSSPSSSTWSRADRAANIGRAVRRNVACFSPKHSSKANTSLVLLKPCFSGYPLSIRFPSRGHPEVYLCSLSLDSFQSVFTKCL